ncbi:uncharacterized protein LOC131073118 [Cryptomeria japonica]|uniref:uncharacterized protein LOC131073118 n=1 Tax=Cryptomeria japonica TaxID=3369 RepID=UPI0027DA8546|nr:uncharacterized protein LOC131073118 [Cryptomeria japonica]
MEKRTVLFGLQQKSGEYKDMLQWQAVRSVKLIDFLLAWPTHNRKSKWGDNWIVRPSMLVWHVWREMNRRTFSKETVGIEEVISKLKDEIQEVVNVNMKIKKIRMLTNWDKEMEKRWVLEDVSGGIIADKRKKRSEVVWECPPLSWVKLNFDGASKGNSGRARYGAIVRDDRGDLLWCVSGFLGIASNNEADLKGLEVGLTSCVDKGFKKVVIKGDS